ncbi:bacteriophage HK97-gp10, tail-component family protein [Clostridium botulinum]|uniref:HK97-gp10 family putative phage morphogenesis protein n=1 Tax=Clostridium botulinum TaxID=1491 RepID=UPI000FCCDC99|nr:HK97-gp10 family putative phage morphogenesis protein [Clostridium botulinum]RUT53041.1 bacteriophage HK97-gp10, tail-component family protein [Clostridium botulinum]
MNNGIEIEGMEEFTNMLENMTLGEADERKAVRLAIEPIAVEVEKNSPVGKTKRLKKISKTVKKDGLATVGIVRTKAFYDLFQEFGTSQQKHHVGYFERSVKSTEDKAISILAKELLDKVR